MKKKGDRERDRERRKTGEVPIRYVICHAEILQPRGNHGKGSDPWPHSYGVSWGNTGI